MSEDRALANAVLIFAITLIVGAMMILVLDPIISRITLTNYCEVQACTTGAGWLNDAWTWFALVVVGFAFVGFIRFASTESRRRP